MDPSISSFNFTTNNEDRIRSLQLLQQQAADSSDEEDELQMRHGAELHSLNNMIADGTDHSDPCAVLRSRSTYYFSRGNHEAALSDANESLLIEQSCVSLFCKGRALAGLTKYGPAEMAFRMAHSTADDAFKVLIERELRHLQYNVLKSMELKDNSGQQWTNPIEAFRISRRDYSLNDAITCYTSLTEPKTRNWDDAKTKLNWNQPVAQPPAVSPLLPDPPAVSRDDFHSPSPLPIAVPVAKKPIGPPPGFAATVSAAKPPAHSPGPIQRPAPAAIAQPAKASGPKTAAQLVSSNKTEWQTAGTKIRVKKPEASDLPTNVYGCEGVWVGGISPKCSHSELAELFKRYGTIKTYNMGKSKDANYMFVSYDAPLPPAKAVREMNGQFVKKITVTQENPLIVRFEPSQTQRPIFQTWSLEKTREKCHAKGECFSWRTKEGCYNLTDCPYAHHDRNRGVDSCSWLNKTKK